MNMLFENMQTLIEEYRYKIELHAHTRPASGCSHLKADELFDGLQTHGYHVVVLTNHFSGDLDEDDIHEQIDAFTDAKKEAEKHGMTVLLGSEYRLYVDDEKTEKRDFLVYGVDEDFLWKTGRLPIDSFREFHDKYCGPDRILLQAHPMRSGILVDTAYIDGLETYNMCTNDNSACTSVSLHALANNVSIVTAGSDIHEICHLGACALRSKVRPENNKELIDLLRSGDYFFEIGGMPVFPHSHF